MVGLRTLTPSIKVQILVPQPLKNKGFTEIDSVNPFCFGGYLPLPGIAGAQ